MSLRLGSWRGYLDFRDESLSDLVQPYMAGARLSDIIGSEDVEPGSPADDNPTRFKRDCSRARKVGVAVDRHRPVRSVDDVVGVRHPEAANKIIYIVSLAFLFTYVDLLTIFSKRRTKWIYSSGQGSPVRALESL